MGKAGRVLKTVLNNYGISQGKLATEMGIGSSNVYRWVNEIRDPNSETVADIVKALNEVTPAAANTFIELYLGELVERREES